jgi:hypothetical protein
MKLSRSTAAAELARLLLLPLLLLLSTLLLSLQALPMPALLLLPFVLLLVALQLPWLFCAPSNLSQRIVAGRMRLKSPSTDSITAGTLENHKPHICSAMP